MKVGLQTWGSTGDIYPFIALAAALHQAGHDVTLAYTNADGKDYDALATSLGVHPIKVAVPGGGSPGDVIQEVVSIRSPLQQFAVLFKHLLEPAVEAMHEASKRLCRENDAVIGHSLVHTLLTAAESERTARGIMSFSPLATDSYALPPSGVPNLGRWANRLLWWIGDRLMAKHCFPTLNPLRVSEGLPPLKSIRKELYASKRLTLVAASPNLCPPLPDWGEHVRTCGFLALPRDSTWQMPEDLRAFIEDGEPPIFMTFGSLSAAAPEASLALLVKAARLSGRRAIIQGEWEGVQPPPEDANIHPISKAPHSRIFPHCALVVHHGGAGTTHSALAAGNPAVVVAHAFDQPFWAKQLRHMGVGGKTLWRRDLTPRKLAGQIRAVLDSPDYAERAERLGKAVAAENPIGTAVSLIEERLLR